jgi:hypothetical protein
MACAWEFDGVAMMLPDWKMTHGVAKVRNKKRMKMACRLMWTAGLAC